MLQNLTLLRLPFHVDAFFLENYKEVSCHSPFHRLENIRDHKLKNNNGELIKLFSEYYKS